MRSKNIEIDECIDLGDDEYVVTWHFRDGGIPVDSVVSCEYEGKDPGCGIPEGYWFGTGDCPKDVEEYAAEMAADKAADAWDDSQEYERE